MNIKMRYLAAITAGMLLAANIAAQNNGTMILVGVGANSCGKFVAETKDDDDFRVAYFFWAQGFLSGLNYKYFDRTEFSTNLADHNALQLWIENYCEENPLDMYGVATIKLWSELRTRQGLDSDLLSIQKD